MKMQKTKTIAVLPFVSLSDEKKEEYFSDGITEEILNLLVKVDGLLVTARTSSFAFKNRQIDVREIGKKLEVETILEGSVRRSNQKVRVTAQLIDVASGYTIWSDNWTKELVDIFDLQDEIANEIVKKINIKSDAITALNKPMSERASNIEAYNKYLKGKYYLNQWTKYSTYKAINQFEKSIALDPAYPNAYFGLFSTYIMLGALGVMMPIDAFKEAEKYYLKLKALDPSLTETTLAEASLCFWNNWEFEKASNLIQKAILTSGASSESWQHLAMTYIGQNKTKEALEAVNKAAELDPLSYNIIYCKATILYIKKDFECAIELINKNIKLNPFFINFYITKGFCLMHLGRYHEAIQTLSNIQIGPKKVFKDKGGIGVVKAFQGKHIEAEEILNELLQNLDKERNPINSLYISIICAKIGRTEEALLFLERGLQAKLPGLIYITIDPTWECLTSHKSFQKILPEALKSIKLNSKAEKYSKSYLCADRVASIKRRLTHLMEVEKIYLENNLSLIDVANHVKESSIILSQIFNQHMGTNFYDYVNDYRLKEFTQKIKDDNLKDFTIIAIAGQCGFSSKSAFNSYVKKTTNQTPKQYLNSILELEHA